MEEGKTGWGEGIREDSRWQEGVDPAAVAHSRTDPLFLGCPPLASRQLIGLVQIQGDPLVVKRLTEG